MVIYSLSLILSLLSVTVPFLWGHEPERQGAKIFATMLFLSIVRNKLIGIQLEGPDHFGFVVDIVGFTGFLMIALFAMRVWPLWAAALQLIAVTAHLVMACDIHIHPMAYLLMRYAPSYLVSIILLLACIRMRWRGSATDKNSSWRVWSVLSILGTRKE